MGNRYSLLCFLLVFYLTHSQALGIKQLTILNTGLLSDQSQAVIIRDGQINSIYDDAIFNNELNCRNGNLQLINSTSSSVMNLSYIGSPISNASLDIVVSPNDVPLPTFESLNSSNLLINFNCPPSSEMTNSNYFNKVTVTIFNQISFSFKIDCDPNNPHKSFQYGYIIISIINMFIIVGVAFHSQVWSIKINKKPMRVELTWLPFLIFSMVGVLLVFGLILYASKDLTLAFSTVTYFGIAVSFIFVFLGFNECFYLMKALQTPLYRFVRICEALSIACAIGITILAVFEQSWILYDILAGFICVGSIKIFHFRSLKQAYISMSIMVITVAIVTSILHFILPRLYNDYATQLSSPLFMMVPDISENVYKQCSWLSITDIIIPGATLSYLRLYDQNRSSKYGGVYTVGGNITFILSTVLWLGVELVFPYTVPFCIVTYLSIMFIVFMIAWRRNEWNTLYRGTFVQDMDMLNENMFASHQKSPSQLLNQQIMDGVKRQKSESKNSGSIIQPSST